MGWYLRTFDGNSSKMKYLITALLPLLLAGHAFAARAPIKTLASDPYTSAIVIDADTGTILVEENADTEVYPASVVKLMSMLIITERIESGQMTLTDQIPVTGEAARMGGAQVYLAEGESFTLEEMLYALAIKSANDVAVALAIHIGGSKDGFVKLMNERAAELGLTATTFASVHGLPPDEGQKPDRTTARDIATLSMEILKHPSLIKYTSAKEKWFRNDTFEMMTHNRLLHNVDGCDGLKTGYFKAAGFSIAATAKRQGRRVIAVVMGSTVRQTRDDKTADFINQGFTLLPKLPATPPPPAPTPAPATISPTAPTPVATPPASQPDAHPLLVDSEPEKTADEKEAKPDKKSFPWLTILLVPFAIIGVVSILRHFRII